MDDTTVYRVEYRASDAAEWTLDDDAITSATHTVDGLVCNTAYEFPLSAYGDGETYVADWGSGSEVSANNRHLQLAVALRIGIALSRLVSLMQSFPVTQRHPSPPPMSTAVSCVDWKDRELNLDPYRHESWRVASRS